MDLGYKILVSIGIIVTVSSVVTTAAVIDVSDSIDIDTEPTVDIPETNENVTKCHLRQTMAWQKCQHKNCQVTCQNPDDCTFPYCNSLGQCDCRKATCKNARICYFYRIVCTGHFICEEGNCICEK